MRTGPKPLPFQLGMASLASAGLAGGARFEPAVLQDFFRGIQKYQQHPFRRAIDPLPAVWQDGTARLLDVPGGGGVGSAVPVVLIPSMVNRSDILDLMPGKSFARWLAGEGFETYLFDWGALAEDPGQQTMEEAFSRRLVPALKSLGRPVLLLGYCMGGLFAAAVAARRDDLVRGCVLLATPWDFHDEKAYLRHRMTIMQPMAAPYMKQHGKLPESWMQAVFASLDPEGAIKKFASFAGMQDAAREELFICVEDWLNDGIDLPAAIATECMEAWYERNEPFAGEWHLGGGAVRAADIKAPTFVITARDDKIVPQESALAFAAQRTKSDQLVVPTGHVGLMAGSKAQSLVWRPIADWFAVQQ